MRIKPSQSSLTYLLTGILAMVGFTSMSGAVAQALNPNYFYYFNGKSVERSWSVGEDGNWSTPLENGVAKSIHGKVSTQLDNYQGEGDAIRAVWSKSKTNGKLTLEGNPINIKDLEHKAALTFEIKVNKKPTKPVEVSMDCGWPCSGKVHVRETLQKAEKSTWFMLPIPLNCFSTGAENFDLSKISSAFVISTQGKMDISLANIRLELLPEGEKGCAEES